MRLVRLVVLCLVEASIAQSVFAANPVCQPCAAPTSVCYRYPLTYPEALKRAEDASRAEWQVAALQNELSKLKSDLAAMAAEKEVAIAQAKDWEAKALANAALAASERTKAETAANDAREATALAAKNREEAETATKKAQKADVARKAAEAEVALAKQSAADAKSAQAKAEQAAVDLKRSLSDAQDQLNASTKMLDEAKKKLDAAKKEDAPKLEEDNKRNGDRPDGDGADTPADAAAAVPPTARL